MGAVASQITSLTIVHLTVDSDADQRKTSKLRVTSLCAGNSPGTGEMASNAEKFPFDDVIMVQIMTWRRPGDKLLSEPTRQIRTPVLRIPPAVTSQAKMKNRLHEYQKWVSHMIGQYAHI